MRPVDLVRGPRGPRMDGQPRPGIGEAKRPDGNLPLDPAVTPAVFRGAPSIVCAGRQRVMRSRGMKRPRGAGADVRQGRTVGSHGGARSPRAGAAAGTTPARLRPERAG